MASGTPINRRSGQRQASRKRPRYYESDNDGFEHDSDNDAFDRNSDDGRAGAGASSSQRRSARQVEARERLAHEDSTSEEQEEIELLEGLPPPQRSTPRKRRRTTRSATQSHRSRQRTTPQRNKKQPRSRPRALGAPLKKKDPMKSDKPVFSGPSDGRIPDWTSLPFKILRDIFVYASQPLHDLPATASVNVAWLIRAARTCRAFALPALETYYVEPPMLNTSQPHRLLELVRTPTEKSFMNYRIKVKSLAINVIRVAYAAAGRSLLNVGDLVKELPMLQEFEIWHPIDLPPFRSMQNVRWTYPQDLFDAFDIAQTQLKTWRWSRQLVNPSMVPDLYGMMTRIHQSRAFQSLTVLVVSGFDAGKAPADDDNTETPEVPDLATAISALSSLKDVTFISCEAVMDKFLERLPKNLERLELTNCLEVHSSMLESFLESGGHHLLDLELHHNPGLSLEFLPRLKAACPRLESLTMDLTYYSERYNFNDAWAMYDVLLGPTDVPTWPSTLRYLELSNLSKWSADGAEECPDAIQNLFRSLIDSAKDLVDLRHLSIEAHISIPWRDRAGFREQWIDRLKRTFLRKAPPPDARYGSFKQIRAWKASQAAAGRVKAEIRPRPSLQNASSTPVRRSKRVVEDTTYAPDSEEETTPTRVEIKREQEEGRPSDVFVQGLCDVVDIRIDNKRPREQQFEEVDFLDSEPSGDEDWHEGRNRSMNVEDGGYIS